MAGLVPAIHVFLADVLLKTWMPGTRPGMTKIIRGVHYFFPYDTPMPARTSFWMP
jgi:hypothetical protein